MKLTAIILLMACLAASAKGHSQNVTITLKDAPLEKAFAEIKRQTGYGFVYKTDLLEHTSPISISVKNGPLQQVLDLCLKNQLLTYKIFQGFIVIKSKDEMVGDEGISLPRAPIDVHGRVVDENGDPVDGVSVKIKGTDRGTATNSNGDFTLINIDANAILVFTGVNIESFEQKANGKSDLLVNAKTRIANLQEVVVNKGYYTVKQRDNTGDVTVIKGDDIRKQPVSNPLAAMEGRVPGLVINQTTGVPGGGFNVQIRGKNSLLSGTDPLYVVDGVPYLAKFVDNSNLNSIGKGGNPLNFINPADIERIDVLKDADATSIYGSRGSNGVILITTRKGKTGKMKVNISAYQGFGKVTRTNKVLNTTEYLQMRHEAFNNDGIAPTTTNAVDLMVWDTTRYTDWKKVLIGGTAKYTDIQGSVSGGTANTQYLVATGYHRETTVFPSSDADQKANVHFFLNTNSTNQKFKLQLSASYVFDNSNLPNLDLTQTALALSPNAPALYNKDGSLNWAPKTPGGLGTWTNPLATIKQRYHGQTSNLVSNAIISYSIFKGLDIKTSLGCTIMHQDELTLSPLAAADPGAIALGYAASYSQFSNLNSRTWIIEPQIDYNKSIKKIELSALVGATFQKNLYDENSIYATGFSSDAVLSNPTAAPTIFPLNATDAEYKYNAAYARINVNYGNKYIVNFTGRRDGTSRFGPDNQFANFGAIGAAWRFSQESVFAKTLPFISFGQLKLSYGTTGNDQIGDYKFLDLYNFTNSPYQGVVGIYPRSIYNPGLAWELNKKAEISLQLGLFSDRINIGTNYFRNRTSNQVLSYKLSDVTGFSSILTNLPATIQNSGLEIVLNSINVRLKGFTWSSTINLTVPRNKLLSFPGLAASSYSTSLIVGQPFQVSKLYDFVDVDPQTGQFRFKNAQGTLTNIPTTADRTIIYKPFDGYVFGGFENNFKIKNIGIDLLFQFAKQKGIPDLYYGLPGIMSNQPVYVLDHWKKPGNVAQFPKYTQNFGSPIYQTFPYFNSSDGSAGTDASFIRLKNLSISYTIPDRLISKAHMENLKLFVLCQNLFTITKYKGNDPETMNNNGGLPPLRVISFGLQASF